MIAAESRHGRRIIGRLERGADLLGGLETVCRERDVHAGELRALGSLEAAELSEYDQTLKVWKPSRKLTGGFELVNLTGNVSERDGQIVLHAHVTLMRDRDSGLEVTAGHLVTGRVFALEFIIETWDDVVLKRTVDNPTGLPLWREILPAPTDMAAATWRDVTAASARKTTADRSEEAEEGPVETGDIIVHPTFGRCEVQRIEGEYEFAHVRLQNGRLVRLSLDVLRLTAAGHEDRRRVFRARVE